MNIVRENVDALNAVLTVKIEKPDYESQVEAKLRDYRRKAQVPGFRPGMVPMGMIKKMYQKSATVEEVSKKIPDGINDYVQANHLHLLGEPIPSDKAQTVDFDTQTEFEFKYDVAIAPEVQLTIDSSITIPYYNIAIPDGEVQRRIETTRAYYGKIVRGAQIKKDDLATVDLAQSKEGGLNVENVILSLKVIPEAEQQALLGLPEGASVEVNVRKMLTNDVDCAAFLKITRQQLEEVDPVFTITIKEISHVEPAEMNQEFFDTVYGEGVVRSEEEFIDRVKSGVRSELLSKSNQRFNIDTCSVLVQKAALELPEAFLKRWLLLTAEGKMTENEVEETFPNVAEKLRWDLIVRHILQQQNIEVTERDLLNAAKKIVMQRLVGYGVDTIREDRLVEFAQSVLNRPEERKHIIEYAIETRVIEHVRSNVTIEQKEVSSEEFNEINSRI
ncbi:MAG: trigger factor [Prevotellaceae bacterium]|jgi:trigger factor|nr:trigger factor [Prevotellaceae bacterium]